MKKIFILLAWLAILSSCSIIRPQERAEYVSFLDYRPYTTNGFFLSPNSYPGAYESIGEMRIIVVPEIVEESNDYYMQSYVKKDIPESELLANLVKQALLKGANGISNLSIKRITTTTYTKYSATSTLSHYEISGLLIMCK